LLAVAALAAPAVALALPDFSSHQIVAALNHQRAAYGVPPVRESRKLSAGCADHNRYLIRNGASYLLGSFGHFEVPGLPGYTRAGNRAAQTSVLAWGTTLAWKHGDPWNTAGFHIFQLLNPAIAVTGADERQIDLGAPYGQANLECLTTLAGPYRKGPKQMKVYFVPRSSQSIAAYTTNTEGQNVFETAPGQSGPPLLFVYFLGRHASSVQVRAVHASLGGHSIQIIGAFVGGASGPPGIAQNPSFFASPEPAAVLTFPAHAYNPAHGTQPLKVSMQVRPSGGAWRTERLSLSVKH
jgi:hypothetical protein